VQRAIEKFTPYYERTGVRLYHGDACLVMDSLPAESVDMIFADPPYGLSNGGFSCHGGRRVSVNKGAWDKSKGWQEDKRFHERWISACHRVLKSNGTLWVSGTYHSIYCCGFIMQSQGWHMLNEICWYKPNAPPHLACRMFAASHETLLWARKTKTAKHYFDYQAMKESRFEQDFFKREGKQMRSVWALNTPLPHEKKYGKHPTQKPLSLLERIVVASCPLKGVVLDPFCGSATSGVASVKADRKFIGIDSDESYLELYAVPRLTDVMKEMRDEERLF